MPRQLCFAGYLQSFYNQTMHDKTERYEKNLQKDQAYQLPRYITFAVAPGSSYGYLHYTPLRF